MKLRNKSAIVTGGASGIGKEVALMFAREGAKVAICDPNKPAADAVAAEIRAAGGRSIGVAMDVCTEEGVKAGVAATVAAFGGVDVLVCSAGSQIAHPIGQFSYADWTKMLTLHLNGAFLATRACLPHMHKSGRGGSIIYMCSVHSKEEPKLEAPRVTAEHGLIGLAKIVAKQGAPYGVHANVIRPGFVRAQPMDKARPAQARELAPSDPEVIKDVLLEETADSEFTTIADVAEAALFVAAFPTHALTGQSLTVRHGWFIE